MVDRNLSDCDVSKIRVWLGGVQNVAAVWHVCTGAILHYCSIAYLQERTGSGIAERPLRQMLAVKFLDSQLDELRIVEPQSRPKDRDFLDRVHVKISANVFQTRARWRRFLGLRLAWFRLRPRPRLLCGQIQILYKSGGFVGFRHAFPLCTIAVVFNCVFAGLH